MRQLEQIAAKQSEINEQLGALQKWRTRMDSDVTRVLHHELRTPLNAIMGISDLLDDIRVNDTASDNNLTRFAGILRRNGQDLLDRISDLLELPGLCTRTVPLESREVDIAKLLQQLLSRVSHKVEERGLRLEFDLPTYVHTLCCDRVALQKVFLYLVDNAIKFTPRGTVLVRLIANETGMPVALVIVDQGIGIDDEHVDKIYEPFFQVDQGVNRQYGGLGLGLCNARRLCEEMGYSLEVDSRPGFGATFTVRFGSSMGV
jgi:signal transduction histidine kinase